MSPAYGTPEWHEEAAAALLPSDGSAAIDYFALTSLAHSTLAISLRSRPHFTVELEGANTPCGATVVLERQEGYSSHERWCPRTEGPCPFPGADPLGDGRDCAAEAGR